MDKIVFVIIGILFFVVQTFSQEMSELQRLSSTRNDVVKLFGKGQKISESKVIYDLKDKKLVVFYFGNSCSESFLLKNQFSKDTVIGVTVFPKTDLQIKDVITKYYRKFELLNYSNAYLSADLSQIIIGKVKNGNEYIETIYYLTSYPNTTDCSETAIKKDSDSGFSIFEMLQERSLPSKNHAISMSYYSGESIALKKEVMETFCKTLNEFQNGEGFISVLLRKNESKKRYVYYENYLKKQLVKNKCNMSQVKLFRGGVSIIPNQAFFQFQVLPEKIEVPK